MVWGQVLFIQVYLRFRTVFYPISLRYCLSLTIGSSEGGMLFRKQKLLYCSELKFLVGGDNKFHLISLLSLA